MRFRIPFFVVLSVSLMLSLAACQSNSPTVQVTPPVNPTAPTAAAVTNTPEALPTGTATAEPPRTLVVCTQDEPATLYPYGGNARSMWSVLEAIYDGPFDTRSFATQPVILQKIPSMAEGDAVLRPVTVRAGEPVIDVDGNLVALQAGTRVLPSGCTRPDCAVAWDGSSELSLDQLVVTFKLLPNLLWSDGTPLTAADSVFSYSLAADPATPASKYLTDRTASYTHPDDLTVEWTGLPGFYEQRYGTFFFLPLPKHAWGQKGAAELVNDPASSRAPLGWGPYVVQEWTAGDHITLQKNPNYFRAAEGLPKFDTLVVRFIGDTADGNMNALLAGECDVIDQNMSLVEMIPGLLERENGGKLKMHVGQGPEWEHLDFGIRPATYDDGYNAATDRLDLFGDARTRQAFAYCIDREKIIADLLFRRSDVPNSYLPPAHPLYQADLAAYPFNPTEGARLLDEVGWKDADGDPATPRVAAGVAGVPDGTPLSVNYATTQAGLRLATSQAAAASLSSACGIGVTVQPFNPAEMFAPGPEGLVFGRKFDLVQFSWEASARPNCLLFTSAQIPSAANQWTRSNVTGFADPAFDSACAAAYYARQTDADYVSLNRQVQEQFVAQLPVIPLYFYPKIALARTDLCGFDMDVTARSVFWNIEALNYGQECP